MSLIDLNSNSAPPNHESPSADYVFAHYALRQVALADPLKFLAIVASPNVDKFLEALLQDVIDQCQRRTTFDAESIKVHQKRVHAYPTAVLKLGEPIEVADAYMVALVLLVDTSAGLPADSDPIKARFFTLEKGVSMANEPRTVLGEWNADSHANFGNGPAPTVDDFVAAMAQQF